jgi:hypothetical protein
VEGQPVPEVVWIAPAEVRVWVASDVDRFSIVAARLPGAGGGLGVMRVETTGKAIRRLIGRLGGPEGLAVG